MVGGIYIVKSGIVIQQRLKQMKTGVLHNVYFLYMLGIFLGLENEDEQRVCVV